MLRKRYILLATCLLLCAVSLAQASRSAPLEVRRDADTLLRVIFSPLLPPSLADTALCWPGLVMGNGHPGHPDLPTASALLRFPKGSVLRITAIDGDETLVPLHSPLSSPLPPVPPPSAKSTPMPPVAPDKAVYSTDTFYRGGSLCQLEDLGVMGEWQLFRLTVRPLSYNPVSGTLRHYRRLAASLTATVPLAAPPIRGIPDRYLLVAPPKYRDILQPFVHWKRREGFEVVELYPETALRDSIQALMRPLFTEATPLAPSPKYILLVGDASDLPPFVGTTHPSGFDDHATDLPYADFTGDHLPDALLGRWPVADTAQLRLVVDKTLRYEQGQWLDTAALRRVLLVAGAEERSVAPTTTNGQVDYLAREIRLQYPDIDTLCYRNPASATQVSHIVSEIGQGVGLVNYTAHCTANGWSSPSVTASTLDTIPSHMPMLYVNNCCRSNSFSGPCFGQQLLLAPQGGGIGVIGATNETLWNEDYYWAVGGKHPATVSPVYAPSAEGAFDKWIGRRQSVVSQGELLREGNLSVAAFGSPYASFYWEIYCLLGDPSLMPFIDVPQPIVFAVAQEVRNGQVELPVLATPGVRVTAMQHGRLLGFVDVDSTGTATIPLCVSLDTSRLIFTSTGRNRIPRTDTVLVQPTVHSGVALRNVLSSDSNIACLVENVGTVRLDSLRITLAQTDEDTLWGAVVAVQSLLLPPLLPAASREVILPIRLTGIGYLPLWQAHIRVEGDSTLCFLPVRHPFPLDHPSVELRLLTPEGIEVRRLMPGHNYVLQADVSGTFDAISLDAGHYHSDSTRLFFSTSDSLCRLDISATLFKDRWQHREGYFLDVGHRTENFEEGFSSYPWDTLCRVPWRLDSTCSHGGRYSIRSGAIGHDQTSDIMLDVLLPHDDTISFWAKLSTESQHDLLVFSVDGQRCTPTLFGEFDWRQYRYRLPKGRHSLRWRYIKDNSVSRGSDCVWIDDISLPMVYWSEPITPQCLDTVGIELVFAGDRGLELCPNPSSNWVSITTEMPAAVRVTDVFGRLLTAFRTRAEVPFLLDVSGWSSGMYFFEVQGVHRRLCAKLIVATK